MKKSLIALLALASVASATNYYGGATENPFAQYATAYTLGQDYTLTFTLGSSLTQNDSGTILILDNTNWGVYSQQGQYVGMDEGANGVEGSFDSYTTRTAFNTTEKREGWFINYGSVKAINGITIKIEGIAAKNSDAASTVMTFSKSGKDDVTMTINNLVDFKGINIGQKMSASNISFTTPSVPEPTTGTLSLLALAGLCARRRKK